MRQQGCRQCDQITSGDCGQHGPSILPVFNLGDEKDITRLRAERLICERDEALAALNDAKKALKIMNQNLDDLSRAKQEALAQVAILLDSLDKERQCRHDPDLGHVVEFPPQYAAKARALLDRLAMLEDGAMTNQRLVWLEDRLQLAEAVIESARKCREDLVERDGFLNIGFLSDPDGLDDLMKALAAWEEGTA